MMLKRVRIIPRIIAQAHLNSTRILAL
uniref:Uncharacterized protein n=1 Tax=Anguilla anguilla TaxID=7936 RepID=A0A0E9Q9Z4_ANGAN